MFVAYSWLCAGLYFILDSTLGPRKGKETMFDTEFSLQYFLTFPWQKLIKISLTK